MSIPECRVQTLSAFVKPRTKRDMCAFLGAMSYYRRFIKGFGSLSSHLTPAVSLRAHRQVEWTRRMESAYGELKQSLCDHVMLCVPSSSDDLRLYTDASGNGIEACLHVVRDGEEFPVAFFSRQLRPAEKNYSIMELESLAIVAAIRHFERLVYARPLEIVTDHRACLALLDGQGLNRRRPNLCQYGRGNSGGRVTEITHTNPTKWLLLFRVLDILAVGEGEHRKRRVGWMR